MRRGVPAADSIARPKRRKTDAVRWAIDVEGLPVPEIAMRRDRMQGQLTGGPSLSQIGVDPDDLLLPGVPEGHRHSVALVALQLLPGRGPARRAEMSAITEEAEMIRASAASAGEHRIGLPLRHARTAAATEGPISIKEASDSG